MVTCRCGCKIQNSYWDSVVTCPDCNRTYPNLAPDMYHPLTFEELKWTCKKCGTVNEFADRGCERMHCVNCGRRKDTGETEDEYNERLQEYIRNYSDTESKPAAKTVHIEWKEFIPAGILLLVCATMSVSLWLTNCTNFGEKHAVAILSFYLAFWALVGLIAIIKRYGFKRVLKIAGIFLLVGWILGIAMILGPTEEMVPVVGPAFLVLVGLIVIIKRFRKK